ncbi:MAG: hypothetical protein PPP58_03600 [Natronomonas sp.]
MGAGQTTEGGSTFRVLPTVAMIVGAIPLLIGALFLPFSLYAGLHTGAIGASIFLAGLVSTRWAATRWSVTPADQRKWSRAFLLLAGLLITLWILVNTFVDIEFFDEERVEEG